MEKLFPEIEPFDHGHLQVSDTHRIFFERCGNENGTPVVFLHGGPGGGISPLYRRFFDPEKYHIILFDQRGAGKSTPHAELKENTTWDLVGDIESLREKFGIDKWHVFGGSWGSTLAMIYAIKHPDRVMSLMLRGIFLCRPQEIQWFYQEGASRIFKDHWEKYFIPPIPESDRGNLVKAYYDILTGDDKEKQLKAAKGWSQWEASTSFLHPQTDIIEDFGDPELAVAFARIECHYFTNNIFTDSQNYILENVDGLRGIPTRVVHGRYDVVCPVENAFDLKAQWPELDLHIAPQSGHSALEPQIAEKLIQFTNDAVR
ncbi:MAG: prolyl aminopeptidase [Bdellovibrionaceae bacterium]|nr:prolyl aminopeptidase [Pseudobdellovibrionaceae bacterium]